MRRLGGKSVTNANASELSPQPLLLLLLDNAAAGALGALCTNRKYHHPT